MSDLQGRHVKILPSFKGNVLGVDFPGWGHPNAYDHLHRPTFGVEGEIVAVESHGSNPWTRYSVRFADGTRASGLGLGTDIELV